MPIYITHIRMLGSICHKHAIHPPAPASGEKTKVNLYAQLLEHVYHKYRVQC